VTGIELIFVAAGFQFFVNQGGDSFAEYVVDIQRHEFGIRILKFDGGGGIERREVSTWKKT